MDAAGIVAEYNPLHAGHRRLMDAARARLGPDAAVVCVMSGNFVQRGDFAVVRKHVRARAAVESGADLVLELPLPWAVGSAERFAGGAVRILTAAGVVTHLAFGSECGDAAPLAELAACLDSAGYAAALRRELKETGRSFAACRQGAVSGLLGPEKAALLEAPNNNLGVEYLRALRRRDAALTPLTLRREDGGHGGPASAGAVRDLLRAGERDAALSRMTPPMAAAYAREEAAGRAPVFPEACRRAVLAKLRSMSDGDFAALDTGGEGLWRRLRNAARAAATPEELLGMAKTKRVACARLRRMVLWAYLGLTPADLPEKVPYLRVLAANERGRALLARMRRSAALPVLTKPADVRKLSPEARRVFALEARSTDLYALAYPDLTASVPGMEWKTGPEIV